MDYDSLGAMGKPPMTGNLAPLFPLLACVLGFLGCGEAPLQTPTQFLAGYAEADITPPEGFVMGGYGPPGGFRRSTGVHDPIKLQVAFIANDAPQAFVVATIDTVGFFHDFG